MKINKSTLQFKVMFFFLQKKKFAAFLAKLNIQKQ